VAETISIMIDDPDKRLDCHVLDPEKDKGLLGLRDLIYTRDAIQEHHASKDLRATFLQWVE
jgi:hypothetical protein